MEKVKVVLIDEDDDPVAHGTVECDTITDVQVLIRGGEVFVLSEWNDPDEPVSNEPPIYRLTGLAVFTEETEDAFNLEGQEGDEVDEADLQGPSQG